MNVMSVMNMLRAIARHWKALAVVVALAVIATDGTGFTHAQIDDAIDAMLESKQSLHGCSIDSVTFDETRSDDMLRSEVRMVENSGADSGSSVYSAIRKYGIDHVAVFTTDYAFAPGSPDAERGWVYIDSGS
ncbi:hypothetical protein BCAL_0843 [Bifidobacterium callitrichos DSM 23973]|uniref:Uncharacterized protein n=2 Tax=Bifidobacterium callitrichos TaxID=762209 RepID=A0A087A735_9BIFI|nr:hypothetical protein BCAL_0843 [Bifidobacterium callitrichos DSM 23973]